MAASESILGNLHERLAETYLDLLKGRPVFDEAGEEVGRIPLGAADLQAINKFLKDNDITCAPDDSSKLAEIEERMRERNDRRTQRRAARAATTAELAEAGGGFLAGLNPGLAN